jgi:hypothetical protein
LEPTIDIVVSILAARPRFVKHATRGYARKAMGFGGTSGCGTSRTCRDVRFPVAISGLFDRIRVTEVDVIPAIADTSIFVQSFPPRIRKRLLEIQTPSAAEDSRERAQDDRRTIMNVIFYSLWLAFMPAGAYTESSTN